MPIYADDIDSIVEPIDISFDKGGAAEKPQKGIWTAEDAALDHELSQLIHDLADAFVVARGNSRKLVGKARDRAWRFRSDLRKKSYTFR
jgi:hypothetical protein